MPIQEPGSGWGHNAALTAWRYYLSQATANRRRLGTSNNISRIVGMMHKRPNTFVTCYNVQAHTRHDTAMKKKSGSDTLQSSQGIPYFTLR